MMPRIFNTLAPSTLRRLVAAVVLSVGISSGIFAVHVDGDLSERQAALLENILLSMSAPVSESIWMVDAPLLQRQLDAMAQIPGVAHVGVSTFIGQEFSADKKAYGGQSRFNVRRIVLRHEEEPLGQLEIWGDSDALHEEVTENVLEVLGTLVLQLLVFFVAAYLLLRSGITSNGQSVTPDDVQTKN